eukprot:TRINITY_DN119_c0_g1::TRINITY_DN119_c0_g1_i1::g.14393::m.14393 TRINITY_DN119_c0_g1::TRINITY_DN119_c0_g1_i1::g.14393  ORF type:complete len:154 (+),score=21.39,sp/Q6K9C3/RZP23_ORYSJ/51.46/4e-26,RRM_1/PF00076.17/6.1e-13,RRM_6/PF14259.1/3.4e-08,RRM_5/PF13893.1/8.8e-08,zf-CCHC/PF00098.18/1.1e-07,zf-CCHC_3/PF13917.1/0.21 TRINITY_DN119_c0_g1_i1:37-498(+)
MADRTKVFFGNLSDRTTEKDLEDFCRGFAVRSVWIARSPPGFGFVTFETERDAEDAVRELNDREMLDRPVRVEFSSGRGRGDRGDDKCFECGEPGHFARDCRNRGGRRRSPPPRRGYSPRRRSPPPRISDGTQHKCLESFLSLPLSSVALLGS